MSILLIEGVKKPKKPETLTLADAKVMSSQGHTFSPAYVNDTLGDGLRNLGSRTHRVVYINNRPFVAHVPECGCSRPKRAL